MATKAEVRFKKVGLMFIAACSVIFFIIMSINPSLQKNSISNPDITQGDLDIIENNSDIIQSDPDASQNQVLFKDKLLLLKMHYSNLMKLAADLMQVCSVLWQSECTIAKNLLTHTDLLPVKNKIKLTNTSIPKVHVRNVSCTKLFHDDALERKLAYNIQRLNPKQEIPQHTFIDQSRDCDRFISDRRYITSPVSKEEEDFPLAFSILIFQDVEQFERLLRSIYRPQNYYCIHVDKKSEKFVHDSAADISRCFPNVFVASQWYDVIWGTFSIVEPELTCMQELLKYKKWKYFINLTGQEFPLKTNWEIVRILKIFNGANNLEGTVARRNRDRVHPSGRDPPINVTLTKGSVHVTASRAFVEYIIYDNDSLLFRDWVKDTYVSDETYFSSLNHSPQLSVPGSYIGLPETDTKKNLFITRFKNWGDGPFNWPCGGKRVRQVCVFGLKDLPLLHSRPELFANKFHLYYEPLTYDCIEELHYRKIRSELNSGLTFDTSLYESLDFVKSHL